MSEPAVEHPAMGQKLVYLISKYIDYAHMQ
jgi:hypothetical protein